MSNKRASIKSRSPLTAFLEDTENKSDESTHQQVDISTSQHSDKSTSKPVKPERTGFYMRPDQNKAIDRLSLDLRDHLQDQRNKPNRSAVVRAALDLLLKQDIQEIARLVEEQLIEEQKANKTG